MSKTDGDKAGEARREAFAQYMGEDGDLLSSSLSHEQAKLAEHFLWRAFTAGERHGRAQLDRILSHGRGEA